VRGGGFGGVPGRGGGARGGGRRGPGVAHLDLPVGDVDVDGVAVEQEPADVGHGPVDEPVAVPQAPPLDDLGTRAGVGEDLDLPDGVVPDAGDVDAGALPEVGAAEEAVETHVPVALGVPPDGVAVGEVLEAVGEDVRVRGAPGEGPELLHGDEAGEVEDLALEVAPVAEPREVEELGALVDLGPEAVLEGLLGVLELLRVLEPVQVGEDAHDLGEAVDLEEVEELERLHLEAEGRVDEQEDEVGDLGRVHHGRERLGALEEGQAAVLARHDGQRARDVPDVLLGVVLHEALDQRRLAHPGRPVHQHHERRRLVHLPDHHGLVHPALVPLRLARLRPLRRPRARGEPERPLVPVRLPPLLQLLLGQALLLHQLRVLLPLGLAPRLLLPVGLAPLPRVSLPHRRPSLCGRERSFLGSPRVPPGGSAGEGAPGAGGRAEGRSRPAATAEGGGGAARAGGVYKRRARRISAPFDPPLRNRGAGGPFLPPTGLPSLTGALDSLWASRRRLPVNACAPL